MRAVPELKAKKPGIALRAAGVFLPGVRRVSAQITPYTAWWNDQNERAAKADGPLLVVIGDSTAIGIGASSPEHGYTWLVRAALAARDREPWRVINLAQSGARVADGLERQLPILADLPTPDLAICCIGTNDVVWSSDTVGLRDRLTELIGGMADHTERTVVATVAGGSPRARLANRVIRNAGAEAGHEVVDPWREPGPGPAERLAEDRFHPNDLGYALMSRPFARQLGAPEPEPGTGRPPAEG